MPRRDYHRDLAEACLPGIFPRVTDVRDGGEDGLFSFTYTNSSDDLSLHIEVTVSDTADYPKGHLYFVYTSTENISGSVTSVLESSHSAFTGLTIPEFVEAIAESLDNATLDDGEDWDHSEYGSDDAQDFDEMEWAEDHFGSPNQISYGTDLPNNRIREKLCSDLRKARAAGFRVGYLGELDGSVILTASCRISNMGISLEAMEALNVRPSEFLVLLVRYAHGYRPFLDVVNAGKEGIQFHAGVCDSYKPSLSSARYVFATLSDTKTSKSDAAVGPPPEEPVLKSMLIEKSLHALLNTWFIQILQCRLNYHFTWTGSELYLNDGQGRLLDPTERGDPKYFERDKWDASSPVFLSEDCLADANDSANLSLLLVAMQFTIRRFVKCTEFCLNCFCKIDAGFEALKPFVCSKGLCLFQYMALGMGPSLEWEITTQPKVVDLLISFAFARAGPPANLEDFPKGLQLKIPHFNSKSALPNPSGHTLEITAKHETILRVHGQPEISQGDWIQIRADDNTYHARVTDVSQWPTIYLARLRGATGTLVSFLRPIAVTSIAVYDTDIDSLNVAEKSQTIRNLLNTLPTLSEMKAYITGEHGRLRPLSEWQDRIHSSTLCILQWIVGSNRSVLLYDDDPQHHVSGMENYVQFRFAQGAPDKEQRFVSAVNQTATRTKQQHPTIFAWHGSPLHNWHSIVREGLHFKYTANGRSCGHGIYMSSHFITSSGYCNGRHSSGRWAKSELDFASAIALNEVVNDPASFICTDPHYVVSQLDWVQPRYLFVERTGIKQGHKFALAKTSPQDGTRVVYGPANTPLNIPISATNSHRAKGQPKAKKRGQWLSAFMKKEKEPARLIDLTDQDDPANATYDNDDADSVSTLLEDKLILLSDDEEAISPSNHHLSSLSQTDFRPGTLNASSIKLMGEPAYATPRATRSLQKLLREALRTQNQEPLHELGWYINGELINNVYQWIVELHSFDKTLQVAKDLKAAGLTSLVLELRFPAEFPDAPPFVRIIRPRFVRFAEGGGGHITAGGAMCMELLTNSGWLPSFSIESVLLQVRMAITNEHPRPARLDLKYRGGEYGVGEAIAEYKRVCAAHGWAIPRDIDRIQW
ncbi:hypothetical protein BJY04DRAFT_228508 [Aspergillus karnatakaensis]|uniref:putative ubiquitin conjugating enzyme n=1 Tax=Aspergillus karnatakaensis TaxID=1810916 RepID=UPI003CCCC4BD